MTLADTLAIFLFVAMILLALPCWWIALAALWPNRIAKTQHACKNNLGLCVVLGLIPLVCLGYVAQFLSGESPKELIQFAILLSLLFLVAQLGVAGLARHIGCAIAPAGASTLSQMKHGGISLTLAFAFPILGTIFLMTMVTCIGFGALVISLFSARQSLPE